MQSFVFQNGNGDKEWQWRVSLHGRTIPTVLVGNWQKIRDLTWMYDKHGDQDKSKSMSQKFQLTTCSTTRWWPTSTSCLVPSVSSSSHMYQRFDSHFYLNCNILLICYVIRHHSTPVTCAFWKVTCGRLRPNFFTVCNLTWSEINCTEDTRPLYITDYHCNGNLTVIPY